MERMTSWGSAVSRLSVSQKWDDDTESSVSEAGDIGDRVVHARRHSLSLNGTPENGRFSISEDHELQQYPEPLNYIYSVDPSTQHSTPVSTNGKFGSQDIKQVGSLAIFIFRIIVFMFVSIYLRLINLD